MAQEGGNEPNVSLDGLLEGAQTAPLSNLPGSVPPATTPPAGTTPDDNTDVNKNSPVITPTGNNVEPTPTTFEGLVPLLSADNISEEHKDTRDLLLSTFKATKVDKSGNLLNDSNEVVLSAAKLKDFIENDKYPVDANGNMVNDKGEVVKTSTQILDENSVVKPLVRTLEDNFSVKLSSDLVFEESEEGIINAVNEIVKEKNKNVIGSFLGSNPILKSFAEHIALGNSPDTFTNTNIDYKSVNVKQLDTATKLSILDKAFTLQETPSKDVIIKLLSDKGEEELNKAVADQVKYLDAKQTETNQKRSEALAQQAEQQERETIKYWEDVNKVVSAGKIGNINIPLSDREAFYNYMSKPIDDDFNSAEAIAAKKDTVEFNLLVSYLRFKGGDISRLASIVAKEEKVLGFKERLAKYNHVSGNGSAPMTQNSNGNQGANIDMSTLLG